MTYDINKEKYEAIQAGQQALNSLLEAEHQLDKAKTWGYFDMFSRGGIISYLVKRNKINTAKENIEKAKYDLRLFSKELNDINIVNELNFDEDNFLKFADWFFDNFFVDWMVQDKIEEARIQVRTAIHKVEQVLKSID